VLRNLECSVECILRKLVFTYCGDYYLNNIASLVGGRHSVQAWQFRADDGSHAVQAGYALCFASRLTIKIRVDLERMVEQYA